MSIVINYKNSLPKNKYVNSLFFVNEQFNLTNLKNYLSRSEYAFLSDLLKSYDLKKKIIKLDLNSKKKNNFNLFKKKHFIY